MRTCRFPRARQRRKRHSAIDRVTSRWSATNRQAAYASPPRSLAPARVPDWRFDPWLFQTFKLAIPKLLDHFQPTGEMKLPGFWQAFRDCPDIVGFPSNKDERRRRTETPEAMADHAVQKVLSDFSDPKPVEPRYKSSRGWALEKMPDGSIKQAMGDFAKEWETTHYGMTRAQEDLAPRKKSRGRK